MQGGIMRIRAMAVAEEAAWSALLSQWTSYEVSIAADWGLLMGLDPTEVIWQGTERVADGLRLQFQSSLGAIWAELTGSPSTGLQVALRWSSDDRPAILHGQIYSQSSKTQWCLSEPIVIDYLPVMVVSDHDWYDLLMTKIYNDDLEIYIRNFYRLLASPNHQFLLLEAIHLSKTEYSWRNRIPDVNEEAELLKPKIAEEQFLKYILPHHSEFHIESTKKTIASEKERLFQSSLGRL
jgi:hypothetical protein